MSKKKHLVNLGLLEEDEDKFKVFPAIDRAGLDEDAHVWEDNWDGDNMEHDFSNHMENSGWNTNVFISLFAWICFCFHSTRKINSLLLKKKKEKTK
uniref:26S proteasome complex subunit SEM1 n=1 Tax=Oryctolagus cuniculus TaxID=9986 RepID=A0A5F9DTI1_RABIT